MSTDWEIYWRRFVHDGEFDWGGFINYSDRLYQQRRSEAFVALQRASWERLRAGQPDDRSDEEVATDRQGAELRAVEASAADWDHPIQGAVTEDTARETSYRPSARTCAEVRSEEVVVTHEPTDGDAVQMVKRVTERRWYVCAEGGYDVIAENFLSKAAARAWAIIEGYEVVQRRAR